MDGQIVTHTHTHTHTEAVYEGVSKSFWTGRLERELPLGAVVSLFCESV
jgi:hypothetical protein